MNSNGEWTPSEPTFSLEPGAAVADRIPFSLRLGNNAGEPGYVKLKMPDGQVLVSHFYGIAYHELSSDKTVLIAKVQDNTQGVLTGPSEVTYPNAFSGYFTGSIRYFVSKSGLEQDILIQATGDGVLPEPGQKSSPALENGKPFPFFGPARWGMDEKTTVLEIYTEFIEGPQPTLSIDDGTSSIWKNQVGQSLADPKEAHLDFSNYPPDFAKNKGNLGVPLPPRIKSDADLAFEKVKPEILANHHIDFGSMRLVNGASFASDGKTGNTRHPVRKQWVEAGNGRHFLVETIQLEELKAQLLDPSQAPDPNGLDPAKDGALVPSNTRELALDQLPIRKASSKKDTTLFKRATPSEVASFYPTKGLLADYSLLSGNVTNVTLTGNETTHITGSVNCFGTLYIEPGAVVKYAHYVPNVTSPSINVFEGFYAWPSRYRPCFFVAEDDQTIGQKIPGSNTNGPGNGIYAFAALRFRNGYGYTAYFNHFRVRNAYFGMYFNSTQVSWMYNGQFQNCTFPVANDAYGTLAVLNCLFDTGVAAFSSTPAIFWDDGLPSLIVGRNVTIQNYPSLRSPLTYNGSSAINVFDNSLLTDITTAPTISGSGSQIISSAGVFQTVVGSKFYLANGSPYRSAGTATLDAALVNELKASTTYPPVVLTSTISIPTIISPQARRDFPANDLGYHYPPVDVVVTNVEISNGSLTLINGAVLGCYGDTGLRLGENAKLTVEGLADRLSEVTWLQGVQESYLPISDTAARLIAVTNLWNIRPQISFRFTEFPAYGGQTERCSILAVTNMGSSAEFAGDF